MINFLQFNDAALISEVEAAKFTASDIQHLAPERIAAMSPAAIGALKPEAFTSLSATQIGVLTVAQAAAITIGQLTYQKEAKCHALSNIQPMKIGEIKFLKDPETLEIELGEKLRAARLNQKFSQQRLAKMAGVALGSVRNVEKGGGATIATFVRMLRALKLENWVDDFDLMHETTMTSLQMPPSITQ